MKIRPIRDEQDYQEALKRIEQLWGSTKGSTKGDELDILVTLTEAYEMHHFPIAPPDPIDAIKFRMEQMGISRNDMIDYLGSQSKVSEVLNGKRPLTLRMIKSLHKGLKIPADVLLAQ